MPTGDDGAWGGADHLERRGGGDRQRRRLHAGTRLRCLAGSRTEAGVDPRTILGKISKRGNKYLRTLFVQAAHVVLARRPNAAMRSLWPWIEQASRRLHRNMLAIALANKLARIAWAVLARGRSYQPRIVAI